MAAKHHWHVAQARIRAYLRMLSLVRKRLLRSACLVPSGETRLGSSGSKHSQYLSKLRVGCKAVGSFAAAIQAKNVARAEDEASKALASGAIITEVDDESALTPLWRQGSVEMSTAAAIQRRFALRQHPVVLEALQTFWMAVLRSLQLGHDDDLDDERLAATTLHYEGYRLLFSRVYRVLIESWDGDDMNHCISEDWDHDRQGQESLTREQCTSSLFELADTCARARPHHPIHTA